MRSGWETSGTGGCRAAGLRGLGLGMAFACALLGQALATGVGRARGKLNMRVGEQLEFAAAPGVTGPVEWRLDDRLVGEAIRWSFAPTAADVGRHRVTVTVTPSGGRARTQAWEVRVRLPRPIRVLAASPAAELLQVPVGEEVWLQFDVESREEGERVDVTWTVDDEAFGTGPQLRVTRSRAGLVRVRALAVGTLGTAAAHEWRVAFEARGTTGTSLPPIASAPTTRVPVSRPTTTVAPPRATSTLPPVSPPTPRFPSMTFTPVPTPSSTLPPPPAPTGAPGRAEASAFLADVAAAWRRRDVAALRRFGQVGSDEQAAALASYFAGVQDLDVQIEVQEVIPEGTRARVRFVRRDTFRNPTGDLVTKVSPPLEKSIVRLPDGRLRFGEGR